MIEKLKYVGDESGRDVCNYEDENGVAYDSKKEYLQITLLGFCGCGNPDDVMVYVRDMLRQLLVKKWGDYEDMPYMFFVYWANNKGFAEHGISARCSWLTEKGIELLSDIEWCLENEKDE